LDALYLLDASVTETNAVRLRFLNAEGMCVETVDDKYKPYCFTAYPVSAEDAETIKYFSGELELVEKTNLFTNEKRALARVYWPNPNIAVKAAERLHCCWEKEIEFQRSYVYDKGLVFGARHSQDGLKLDLDIPAETRDRFERIFGKTKSQDALKHAQIAYWFSLLSQPVPKASLESLGYDQTDLERVYVGWMLARLANIPVAEALSSRRVSGWIRPMIHTYLRKNDFLIPAAEELRRGKATHQVTGALTVSPTAGIYFNTVVCDFESLYPSCIDSFNLSYETVDCPHPECTNNRIPDFEGHVCTKRRGFYSILVGALKELRIRIFKPDSRDNSLTEEQRRIAAAAAKLLKLILVSSYGVTVRIHGVACPPLAEAITGFGRYVLRESWTLAEQNGMHPLYGDTDSLFLDNVSDEQIRWLIETVREKFRLDLAVEKRYSLCVLPKAKKAYFGILPDGSPDIKGVTAIKSNVPRYVTNVFQDCVKQLAPVRNRQEFEEAKDRVREVVARAISELYNRKIEMNDLTYSVRLYFDPNEKAGEMKTAHQPYQSAIQLIDSGKRLKKGDTVSFVKVKPFKYHKKTFTVKPFEMIANISEINVNDYVRNLLTALNQTFEPMGIEFEKEKKTRISDWLTE
jgi:DNA polymerase elongation subunit (family B)